MLIQYLRDHGLWDIARFHKMGQDHQIEGFNKGYHSHEPGDGFNQGKTTIYHNWKGEVVQEGAAREKDARLVSEDIIDALLGDQSQGRRADVRKALSATSAWKLQQEQEGNLPQLIQEPEEPPLAPAAAFVPGGTEQRKEPSAHEAWEKEVARVRAANDRTRAEFNKRFEEEFRRNLAGQAFYGDEQDRIINGMGLTYFDDLTGFGSPGTWASPAAESFADALETYTDNVRAGKSGYFENNDLFEQWFKSILPAGLAGTSDENRLRQLYMPLLVKATAGGGASLSQRASYLTAQASMLQAQVLAGRLSLDEAKYEWGLKKDEWTEARDTRKEERDMRTDRLDAAYKLADTRLTATRELVGALPYIAPKGMEFVPGFGPGGPVETLAGMSDSAFVPHRIEDNLVPFDPLAVAQQAVAEVEAAAKGFG